jgi:pimeloyl-ACP methyl ester carboxylesterase
VAFDHPGFGLSTAAPGYGFTAAEHSAVADGFVKALDLRDVTVVVQDWGGPIGLGAAVRDPQPCGCATSHANPKLPPSWERRGGTATISG